MTPLEIMEFYEGNQTVEVEGNHPTIRMNSEDFATVLAEFRRLSSPSPASESEPPKEHPAWPAFLASGLVDFADERLEWGLVRPTWEKFLSGWKDNQPSPGAGYRRATEGDIGREDVEFRSNLGWSNKYKLLAIERGCEYGFVSSYSNGIRWREARVPIDDECIGCEGPATKIKDGEPVCEACAPHINSGAAPLSAPIDLSKTGPEPRTANVQFVPGDAGPAAFPGAFADAVAESREEPRTAGTVNLSEPMKAAVEAAKEVVRTHAFRSSPDAPPCDSNEGTWRETAERIGRIVKEVADEATAATGLTMEEFAKTYMNPSIGPQRAAPSSVSRVSPPAAPPAREWFDVVPKDGWYWILAPNGGPALRDGLCYCEAGLEYGRRKFSPLLERRPEGP